MALKWLNGAFFSQRGTFVYSWNRETTVCCVPLILIRHQSLRVKGIDCIKIGTAHPETTIFGQRGLSSGGQPLSWSHVNHNVATLWRIPWFIVYFTLNGRNTFTFSSISLRLDFLSIGQWTLRCIGRRQFKGFQAQQGLLDVVLWLFIVSMFRVFGGVVNNFYHIFGFRCVV